MTVKRGLGRNLSALLSQTNPGTLTLDTPTDSPLSSHKTLTLNQLQTGKYQPRREIEDESLHELAESIKQHGLLQPLVVREVQPDHYEIIAGERRWRACQLANLAYVPVIVRQVDDETAMAIALIENLQRQDLNVIDQALALQRLVNEFDLTHQEIAHLLSKSRANVSNYLRLLNLSSEVRCLLERGDLDMGHARCLLTLDHTLQIQVAEKIVDKNLSVREAESLVGKLKTTPNDDVQPKPMPSAVIKKQVLSLGKQLHTKIMLKPGKHGDGKLIIHYEDEQKLKQLMTTLIQ